MTDMSEMTDSIAMLAAGVLEATGGTREQGPLCQATRTVEKVFTRAASRQSHYATILRRLREIGSRTSAILTTYGELTRALFPFKPLTMGFRIETARLQEEEARRFLDLTATITRAHVQALRSVEQYFAELTRILKFFETMGARLGRYSGRLEQELTHTRTSLDGHLNALKDRWSHAAETGAAADAAGRDIVAQIGKIIVATQYQDITRQQLQHIWEALDEIRKEFGDVRHVPAQRAGALAGFARQAGLVQCRQLDVAAGAVDKANCTIIEGMQHILESAGRLSQCPGTSDSPGTDLVDAFRNDIQSMTKLDETGAAIGDELAAWIGPAVKMLLEFGAEIRCYSVGIRLAAINAQILACRAEHGEVLEVLASRLRLAADASLGIIDEMSRVLADIIRDLDGDLNQSRIAAVQEGHELCQEAAQVMALLEQVQKDVRQKTGDLTSLYKKLTKDTQTTIAQTDLQGAVVGPVREVKSALETMVGSLQTDEGAEPDTIVGSRIAALRKGYTMDSERDAHDRVAGTLHQGGESPPVLEPAQVGGSPEVRAPIAPVANESTDPSPPLPSEADVSVTPETTALGDNVELF
jgi:chemotaxis regulatin CheY-phosphate phosphatase CheZ